MQLNEEAEPNLKSSIQRIDVILIGIILGRKKKGVKLVNHIKIPVDSDCVNSHIEAKNMNSSFLLQSQIIGLVWFLCLMAYQPLLVI